MDGSAALNTRGLERLSNHNSAAYLAIVGLDGLNNAQQAEYNRHYATDVTFRRPPTATDAP